MIIFLYGEDDFSSRRKLNEIIAQYRKKNFGNSAVHEFDFKEKDALPRFRERVGTNSLFSEKKFFVLANALPVSRSDEKKEKQPPEGAHERELTRFVKQAARDASSTVLLFWQEGVPKKTNPLCAALLKKPILVQKFERLEGRQLEEWVRKEAASLGGTISPAAARFLGSAVGSDLWRMEQEVLKLVNYKNAGAVEVEDAREMTRTAADSNIFKTIDAIADRDKKAALALIMQELEAGTGALHLMAMIAYQLRNLITVGASGDLKNLKIHPYVLKKTLGQLKRFSFADLKRAHQVLFSFDVASKSGRIQPALALEMLVLEI